MTIFERAITIFFGVWAFLTGLVGVLVTFASLYTGIAFKMPLGAVVFALGSGGCLWLGWAMLAAGFQKQKSPTP